MPTVRSTTGRYQVITIGADGDSGVAACTDRLGHALTRAFDHLGVNAKKFLSLISQQTAGATIDRKMPTVAVFFGVATPALSAVDTDRLADLLGDGVLIIPIVANTGRFHDFVPDTITHLNGIAIEDCGGDFEGLAARVLEGFGLLRQSRRLFISYRRVETSGVATQLYEELDASGFDVFLDTHGVLRPGDPFQEILWHRLADTDVVVLLDSPNFLESRWTEEELARANTSNIQILQLLWPDQEEASAAAFSIFQPLSVDDFDGTDTLGPHARLKETSAREIVDAVEGLRARAVGARHAFLVRQFVLEAKAMGFKARTTLHRSIVISEHGGDPIFIQPAVGVPDAERCETLADFYGEETARGRTYAAPPILLYDDTGIRRRWLAHLKWLNENLSSVRTISLSETKSWLSGLHPRRMSAGGH